MENPAESTIEFGGLGSDEALAESPGEDEPDDAYSVPALRVTPDDDDLIERSSERLDGIEESLERLDDDFQPAGSIGPEVELVFHDPADLLNEDYQEEEVVVDRYSQTDAEPEAAPLEEQTYQVRTVEPTPVQTDDDLEQSVETPIEVKADTAPAELPETAAIEALEQQVAEPEEADDRSTETQTLDMHSERSVPKLKHKDFARLFSNLRRAAQ